VTERGPVIATEALTIRCGPSLFLACPGFVFFALALIAFDRRDVRV
jgi:hypothetical protein